MNDIVPLRQQGRNESIPLMEPSGSPDYIDSRQGEVRLLRLANRKEATVLAALAAGGLVLSPAVAATSSAKKRPAAISLSFDPVSSFTPANADPKLAAALASSKSFALSDFKFTPAPAKGRPSQVRVAVRARMLTPTPATDAGAVTAPTAVSALASTGYNLGAAVGWKRFAISGDVSKVKDADSALGSRETAILGVSYSLNKRLTTRLALGTDRATDHPLPALRKGDNMSVDAGASYSLSRRIALTGGVRYNIEHDRMSALEDDRRDSQAVYVGTAFKF